MSYELAMPQPTVLEKAVDWAFDPENRTTIRRVSAYAAALIAAGSLMAACEDPDEARRNRKGPIDDTWVGAPAAISPDRQAFESALFSPEMAQ